MIRLQIPKAAVCAAVILIACQADARDRAHVRAFRKANPCPATGKASGACHGFVVDHVVPLCGGGADNPRNMQWQSYSDSLIKDRDERRVCAGRRR